VPEGKTTLKVITVRVPPDILKRLPRPSLKGRRADFIRAAIEEKLEREEGQK
jgi:metal-responsive CopG/Arc/MetJ family transcriptional regulator